MRKILFIPVLALLFSCSKEDTSKPEENERFLTVEFNSKSQIDRSYFPADSYYKIKYIVKRQQPPNGEAILWDTIIPRVRLKDMLPIIFTVKVKNLYWGSGQITAIQRSNHIMEDGSDSPFIDEVKLPVKNTDSLQNLQFEW